MNRINPGEQPETGEPGETKIMMLNMIDIVGQFAKTMNVIPAEDHDQIRIILLAICGTLAENITPDTWKVILEHKSESCGEPGCDCHVHANRFIPELHNLKVVADIARDRVRNKEGRGLN